MAASTVAPQAIAGTKPRANTRQQLSRAVAAVFVLDALVIALSLVIAVWLKFGFSEWPPAGIQWLTGIPLIDFGWILPVWVAVLSIQDVYSRRHFARGADEFKESPQRLADRCAGRVGAGLPDQLRHVPWLLPLRLPGGYDASGP